MCYRFIWYWYENRFSWHFPSSFGASCHRSFPVFKFDIFCMPKLLLSPDSQINSKNDAVIFSQRTSIMSITIVSNCWIRRIGYGIGFWGSPMYKDKLKPPLKCNVWQRFVSSLNHLSSTFCTFVKNVLSYEIITFLDKSGQIFLADSVIWWRKLPQKYTPYTFWAKALTSLTPMNTNTSSAESQSSPYRVCYTRLTARPYILQHSYCDPTSTLRANCRLHTNTYYTCFLMPHTKHIIWMRQSGYGGCTAAKQILPLLRKLSQCVLHHHDCICILTTYICNIMILCS